MTSYNVDDSTIHKQALGDCKYLCTNTRNTDAENTTFANIQEV
jgi:hypothetical protein